MSSVVSKKKKQKQKELCKTTNLSTKAYNYDGWTEKYPDGVVDFSDLPIHTSWKTREENRKPLGLIQVTV